MKMIEMVEGSIKKKKIMRKNVYNKQEKKKDKNLE